MAYSTTQNFDFTPNSENPFEIATSFQPDQLDLSANEAGYGSLVNRSIASDLLIYYAMQFPFDQYSQLFGGLETTPTGVKEFFEEDVLFEYKATGVNEDASDVVNNGSGANSYSPSTEGRFVIAAEDESIFYYYAEVRYETANGWQHAYVTSIDEAAGGNVALVIESIDGTSDLEAADGDGAEVQHIATNLPQDLDYAPQPKQTDPEGYKAFVENYRKEISMTRKEQDINKNGGTVVDLIMRYQRQLTENFRRDRETKALLGSGEIARKQMDNGDVVNFSNGIYYQVRQNNLHTSDFKTLGQLDSEKFKKAIYEFMLYNFGGESGGPNQRELFVDPTMQSYFDQAWESSERFQGGTSSTEFVAGVLVNRIDNSQGVMDVMQVPTWSEMHPIKGGQIRGGADPKGVGLLLPIDDKHIFRLQQDGRGPSQLVWKDNPGSRITYQRMESFEGLYLGLLPHMACIEEVAEA